MDIIAVFDLLLKARAELELRGDSEALEIVREIDAFLKRTARERREYEARAREAIGACAMSVKITAAQYRCNSEYVDAEGNWLPGDSFGQCAKFTCTRPHEIFEFGRTETGKLKRLLLCMPCFEELRNE